MQDDVGRQTLEIMAQAKHYNQWIYFLIKPFLQGKIAEVGAGTGTFSEMIYQDGFNVTAIDYSPDYLKIISKKNKKINTFLFDMQSKSLPLALTQKFNTVIILNVIEHLSDDTLAMRHLDKMLKKGGKLIVLVPAFQFAFGSLDKYLGHFRRYAKGSFARLVKNTDFKIIFLRYINFLGLLGWFVNSRILKRRSIPISQVKIFDWVSKPFLRLEEMVPPLFGLSLVCVLEKI